MLSSMIFYQKCSEWPFSRFVCLTLPHVHSDHNFILFGLIQLVQIVGSRLVSRALSLQVYLSLSLEQYSGGVRELLVSFRSEVASKTHFYRKVRRLKNRLKRPIILIPRYLTFLLGLNFPRHSSLDFESFGAFSRGQQACEILFLAFCLWLMEQP